MAKHPPLKTALLFIVMIVSVVGLSIISTQIWGGKPEQTTVLKKLIIEKEMTIIQFGEANALTHQALKEIFGLKVKADLEKKLNEYGTVDQIASMVTKKLALASEHASKNWIKTPVKFRLWFVFLSVIFILRRKRKMTHGLRSGLLSTAILIFGVVLGSDPSPMGTVKDAI